eukprot:UN26154
MLIHYYPILQQQVFLEGSIHALGLMDCMKGYFSYELLSRCGIPKVKLMGTLNDWKQLRKHIEQLEEYDLDWWVKKLLPIADQFIKTYEKKNFHKLFWTSVYKI